MVYESPLRYLAGFGSTNYEGYYDPQLALLGSNLTAEGALNIIVPLILLSGLLLLGRSRVSGIGRTIIRLFQKKSSATAQ
jgi:hypothetical protein